MFLLSKLDAWPVLIVFPGDAGRPIPSSEEESDESLLSSRLPAHGEDVDPGGSQQRSQGDRGDGQRSAESCHSMIGKKIGLL